MAGATPFDEYGSGSESGESRQYAYVEGSGKVEFNVPSAENAVVSGQDTGDATKVYYNEPDTPKALTEGDYHIVLFKGTGYDVVKQMGVFKVSDAATEPNPDVQAGKILPRRATPVWPPLRWLWSPWRARSCSSPGRSLPSK